MPLALMAWLYGPTAPGAFSVLITSREDAITTDENVLLLLTPQCLGTTHVLPFVAD
jgi:hypothetical protein